MNKIMYRMVIAMGVFICAYVIAGPNVAEEVSVMDRRIGRIDIEGTLAFQGKGMWGYKLSTEIGSLVLNILSSEVDDGMDGKSVTVQGDIIKRVVVIDGVAEKKRKEERAASHRHVQETGYPKEVYLATNSVIEEVFIDNVVLNGKRVVRAKKVMLKMNSMEAEGQRK